MTSEEHRAVETPLIPRQNVLVAMDHQPDYQLGCAQEYGVGVEVQTFAFPEQLNSDYRPRLEQMAALIRKTVKPIGAHGAFIDTPHYTQDLLIRKAVQQRYMESLDIAATLGASYVVFHSQYNPGIDLDVYPDLYHKGSIAFWSEFLDAADRYGVVIYLENMFDTSPEPMAKAVRAIGSPHLRLCLDIAHAALFSPEDLTVWIDSFGEHLAHVHLNDTRGKQDEHLGLGQGSLDLHRALTLLKKTGLLLTYGLETGKDTRLSLDYLGIPPQ